MYKLRTGMRITCTLGVVSAALVLCLASPATAKPLTDKAVTVLNQGMEQYDAGDLLVASRTFEQGHRQHHSPVFLYAWAQAERGMAHFQRARDLYRQFLASGPPRAQAKAARANMKKCQRALKANRSQPRSNERAAKQNMAVAPQAAGPTKSVDYEAPPGLLTRTATVPTRTTSSANWKPWIAVGGGTGMLLVSIASYWKARSLASDFRQAHVQADGTISGISREKAERLQSRINRYSGVSALALVGAAGAAITATVMWSAGDEKESPRPVGIALAGSF